jgi:hypothetical protein
MLKRILFFTYGVVSYLIFFGTFLRHAESRAPFCSASMPRKFAFLLKLVGRGECLFRFTNLRRRGPARTHSKKESQSV